MTQRPYDVIIIGGGATGAGTARDCALRGLRALLIERLDLCAGATGRNHGLLHSGARYAVTDAESARECIAENTILRHIARHCVDDTGGLFITLPGDDLEYQSRFVNACTAAGIEAKVIDPQGAIRREPTVNPALIGAVTVPDGAIDPFRLTTANIIDATRHGAEVMTYTRVTGLVREGDNIVGVDVTSAVDGSHQRILAPLVINAGGIWGMELAQMAGVKVNMFPAKGALLIFGHRLNGMVINRCRKPSDADILVPGDTISLIGTTSTRIPFDQVDDMRVTPDEVTRLMRGGVELVPQLAHTRVLRAYAGVRPLVASDDDPTGRSISRGIVCLDHKVRDDVGGLITITGGKLMTYRLMAERATDMAMRKLGRQPKACVTATEPLPGSEILQPPSKSHYHGRQHIIELSTGQKAAEGRHGTLSQAINHSALPDGEAVVCECEQVTAAEVDYAVNELHVHNLVNLRRRTRVGMGTCQGELCACRAAGIMCQGGIQPQESLDDMRSFIYERWRGMMPVAWGSTLVEMQFMSWLYQGVCGLDTITYNPLKRS